MGTLFLSISLSGLSGLSISLIYNPTPGWVKMGWVGLSLRIFDLPNVGLGTYFWQPNQPNNPLGQGNPSGWPYRAGTLVRWRDKRKFLLVRLHSLINQLR